MQNKGLIILLNVKSFNKLNNKHQRYHTCNTHTHTQNMLNLFSNCTLGKSYSNTEGRRYPRRGAGTAVFGKDEGAAAVRGTKYAAQNDIYARRAVLRARVRAVLEGDGSAAAQSEEQLEEGRREIGQ